MERGGLDVSVGTPKGRSDRQGGPLGEPKGPEGKKLWPFVPVTVYCRQAPIAVAVIVTVTDLCAVTVAVAASSPSPSPTPRREFTGLAAGSTIPTVS